MRIRIKLRQKGKQFICLRKISLKTCKKFCAILNGVKVENNSGYVRTKVL